MSRRVELELPDADWLEVPIVDDPAAWAAATGAELWVDAEGDRAPFVASLEVLARKAVEHDAIACAALLPELPTPFVVATLMLTQVHCGDDAHAVAGELSTPSSYDLSKPDLQVVALPAGEAARLRTVVAEPGGAVVESVDHVLPLGDGRGVRLQLSWVALGVGDELAALADGCAAGLRLVP